MVLSNSKPLLNDLNDEAARGEILVHEMEDGFVAVRATKPVEEALNNFAAMRIMMGFEKKLKIFKRVVFRLI